MYWWSNMAVDETADMRVLAPADSAYYHAHDGSLKTHGIPLEDGVDMTYPTRRASASDMYFRIPPGQRPWVTAVDREGRGLIHTSTRKMIGRKMFIWGMGAGGRHWQEFLSVPGHPYVEIQGGLAPTQAEYLRMPAGATWEWMEAYGLLQADARITHGADWPAAVAHVSAKLDAIVTAPALREALARTADDADRAPAEMMQTASGWGALERRRRDKAGETPVIGPATPFDDSTLGDEQKPWLALLEQGAFPSTRGDAAPGAYMVQSQWRELLEKSLAKAPPNPGQWLALLQLGIMRYRAGDAAGAGAAWEKSKSQHDTPWASRNLAVLAHDSGDLHKAADLMLAAARQLPGLAPLAIETGAALLAADQFARLRTFIAALPPDVARLGRVRVLDAQAALRLGDFAAVEAFFNQRCEIPNMREGEVSLSDLWFKWHEAKLARDAGTEVTDDIRKQARKQFPPPRDLDFRMTSDK
jgi:hypothetical protein